MPSDTNPLPPPEGLAPRRVVCAAARHGDHIVCSPRHYDAIMRAGIAAVGGTRAEWEQGFVDQFCTFLTREEALAIATDREQFYRRVGGDERRLYSENLY